MSPHRKATSCSCPPTFIKIGDEVEFLKSCFCHTTAPSFWLKAINAAPGPPACTITVFLYAIGLDEYPLTRTVPLNSLNRSSAQVGLPVCLFTQCSFPVAPVVKT